MSTRFRIGMFSRTRKSRRDFLILSLVETAHVVILRLRVNK